PTDPTLFPYTPLFRSEHRERVAVALLHSDQVVQVLLHEAAVLETGQAVGRAEPVELSGARGEEVRHGVGLHRAEELRELLHRGEDRKSTRLNSSHSQI